MLAYEIYCQLAALSAFEDGIFSLSLSLLKADMCAIDQQKTVEYRQIPFEIIDSKIEDSEVKI